MTFIPANEDLRLLAYNGRWDGYWQTSIEGMTDLRIAPGSKEAALFLNGWNSAGAEIKESNAATERARIDQDRR